MFRSKLEARVAEEMTDLGLKWEYEAWAIDYYVTVRKGMCLTCHEIRPGCIKAMHTYTPDFSIDGHAYVIEVKGRLTSKDRTKLLAVQKGGDEVRLIFSVDNLLNKASTIRYSDWCDQHGFKYAFAGNLKRRWFNE